MNVRLQDDSSDTHTRYGGTEDSGNKYKNLPGYLSNKFPMLGTKDYGTSKENSVYLPEKTLVYLLRDTDWDNNKKVKDIDDWTYTGDIDAYWGPPE